MNPELTYKLSVVRSAHPEWDFDRSFQYLMAQEKQGTFGRPTVSADAKLVAVALDKSQKLAPAKVKGSLVTGAFSLPLFPEDEGYE